jgi:hypothetical protein
VMKSGSPSNCAQTARELRAGHRQSRGVVRPNVALEYGYMFTIGTQVLLLVVDGVHVGPEKAGSRSP